MVGQEGGTRSPGTSWSHTAEEEPKVALWSFKEEFCCCSAQRKCPSTALAHLEQQSEAEMELPQVKL